MGAPTSARSSVSRTRHSPGSVTRTRPALWRAADETARVVRRLQLHVVYDHALLTQSGCEVPHRREDEGDLLLVMTDVGRFFPHLDHQHDVVAGEVGERGDIARKVVAEQEAQSFHY
jgi:hypothetical protein